MEEQITYDTIIKYLVNSNIFSNNINIQSDILKSNFKYKEYFPYKKTGVNKNNSLISSILYLIENEYKLVLEEEQVKLNEIFLSQLKSKWNSLKNLKKSLIDKEEGLNIIKSGNNEKLLQIISNILMLNFIVLDFKDNKYSVEYWGNKVNTFMGFLIIAKYDNNYEPVSNGDKKVFNYEDLDENVKEIINGNVFDKEEVLKMEGYKELENNSFKINLEEYNKTKLNKMKKDQLMNIIEMLKIDVSEKETKTNIIEIILKSK
jgi:hypothetical protein